MNKRIPTYLQYDENTCTDITFSSEILDAPIIARGTGVGTASKSENIRLLHSIHFKKIMSMLLRSQARFVKSAADVPRHVMCFIAKKRLERKFNMEKKLLERELKASGSFRTRKGFVEVCREENCLEQFEDTKQCIQY